ncbi:MAG: hypothetical protein QOJ29_2835, partial [Thermoleophilaceae bacterium]|nr:hypothetical protein [Thermoleophilaceae bacterium]
SASDTGAAGTDAAAAPAGPTATKPALRPTGLLRCQRSRPRSRLACTFRLANAPRGSREVIRVTRGRKAIMRLSIASNALVRLPHLRSGNGLTLVVSGTAQDGTAFTLTRTLRLRAGRFRIG